MARIKGPRKVSRYTAEFKLKAVKLRHKPTHNPSPPHLDGVNAIAFGNARGGGTVAVTYVA